jgi:hypothetical protein
MRAALLLLRAMKQMTRREDPLNFFELNGIDTGIQMTTPLKWPMTRGYTSPTTSRAGI